MQGTGNSMRRHFASLQAGRGLAALVVLLFHLQMLAEQLNRNFAGGSFNHGGRGVDFFFVLSGFIILYANLDHIGVPSEGPRYFYRRLVRIYPLFLSVMLVKLVYTVTLGGGVPGYKHDLFYILRSALLVPQPVFPFINVSWSLCYEIFFYGLFLLVILFGRNLVWCLGAHACACLVFNLPWMPRLEYPADFFLNLRFLQFYAGGAAALLCARNLVPRRLAQAAAGAGAALVGAGLWFYPQLESVFGPLFTVYWGGCFSCWSWGWRRWNNRTSSPLPGGSPSWVTPRIPSILPIPA